MHLALPSTLPLALRMCLLGCLAAVVLTSRVRGQPPVWPDTHYVSNGCYLSTALYLAKLSERYPDVVARAENVRLSNGKLHTIAVVHWDGKIYLRDMFLGVAYVRGDVQRSFNDAVALWLRNGGRHGHQERTDLSSDERWHDVQAAAQWIAALHPQVIQVSSARGTIPVLWWTTAAGELALYEPSIGTAVGRTRKTALAVAMELFGAPSGGARVERVAQLKAVATTVEGSN